MNAIDRDDLAHAISQIQSFYGKELDAMQMKIWIRALSGLDLQRVKTALADYPKHGKYAPKPADILDLSKDSAFTESRNIALPEPKVNQADPEVAKAWAYVIKLWHMGDLFKGGNVTVEQSDEYTAICNRQAMNSGNPESIPPDAWREDIWGCSHESAMQTFDQGKAA